MFFSKKKYSRLLSTLLFDVVSIPSAWYLAYCLRENLQLLPYELFKPYSLYTLAIVMVIQISCYYHFKVYRGLWRFASIDDIGRIIRSVMSTVVFMIPIFYIPPFDQLSHSILPLYAISLVTCLCSGRFFFRQLCDKRKYRVKTDNSKRVLIIGAGHAGENLLREIKRSRIYLAIGILDDNVHMRGLELRGVPVLGPISELPNLASKSQIDLILIAIPSARSNVMRKIVGYCEQTGIQFRTLPNIQDIVDARIKVNSLRPVNIEDLLGRDQVITEWDKIQASIRDKCVLVTGGGGSIGSELCRQIALFKPSKLLVLDNNEYNLYKMERYFNENNSDVAIQLILMDVTDKYGIDHLFSVLTPEIVFHAAAYKHVPMLETQIRVAVYNNVIGTQVLAEASMKIGVDKFILISTDKAVNPTNVMGATKRIAEIFCQNLNIKAHTQFITVRFGNVLGSTGSVVPLFQDQLNKGGPLTVTHPDIQRYFMTIPEATQLILQAMVIGHGGEIFVLDMGEPIKINYLAEQMIRLAGKEPGKDIHIAYTGLRPGEKLFEELFHDSEQLTETGHEKLFKAQFRKIDWNELSDALKLLSQACITQQHDELLILLKNLVPEFNYKSTKNRATCV